MPGIDLYQIYGLGRSQPPEALAAQLTAQLNATDPRDGLTCTRIETARAVLGDAQKRAQYDAALSGPAPVTEEVLARLSGRPAPTAPRPSLKAQFASKQVRVLTGITAALAVILVVGITAVACSGGSDNGSTVATGSDAPASSAANAECAPADNDNLRTAAWGKDESAPSRVLVLDQRIALPHSMPWTDRTRGGSTYSQLGDTFRVNYRGLTQFQDRTIGVFQGPDPSDASTPSVIVTTVAQDGKIVGAPREYRGVEDTPPAGFDLSRTTLSGYYRIAAAGGVQIPAAANGTEAGQEYATQLLADAVDDSVVWAIMRGDDGAIYKGKFYRAKDPSACTK